MRKRYLSVSNFDALQHYKDRNPIWIKLHCAILDDYDFSALPDDTKFHAVGLMLLASRLNNKFPDDEVWLRRKINANSQINLHSLLEIGFLEVAKDEKTSAKTSTNSRKLKKTKGDSASATNETALSQNRTEENRKEHNTTHERRERSPDAENRDVVCDFENSSKPKTEEKAVDKEDLQNNLKSSMFSLSDCLRYAEMQPNINNPQGLATKLFKTGEADSFIKAKLYPEQFERETFGAPVPFSDEPCRVCFGSKMEVVAGKGARPCPHCKNERGKSTGLEPKGENNDETVY